MDLLQAGWYNYPNIVTWLAESEELATVEGLCLGGMSGVKTTTAFPGSPQTIPCLRDGKG